MRRSTVRMKVTEITDNVINEVIRQHKESNKATKGLYERYNQEGLEIQKREFANPAKPNNKLTHDYRGYIINQVVGYLWGNPIAYQVDKTSYSESEHLKYTDKLSDFTVMNAMDDLDNELGKLISICGYAARLLYVDEEGTERAMNVYPWEVVFIQDRNKITDAVRYYTETYIYEGKEQKRTVVEWYDNTNVYVFVDEESKGKYTLDTSESMDHLFDYNPLILFQNNDEEKGDFERVESEINAYDTMRSDSVNEVETFANAYMAFKGVDIDEETMEKMKQSGGIEIDEKGDVFFITKNINDTFVENVRKTLNEDIHKFSASVDMADEKFSGSAQSGESRKWKLIDLENKAGTKTRKFGKGLREQFRVLASVWNRRDGGKLDYLNIHWDFKRNLPVDIGYVGDAVSKLNGIHSKRTLLGQIPYIEDVDYELELMEQEAENMVDLDTIDTSPINEEEKAVQVNNELPEDKTNNEDVLV